MLAFRLIMVTTNCYKQCVNTVISLKAFKGHSLACPHDSHAGAHEGANTLSRGCKHTLTRVCTKGLQIDIEH